MLLTLAQGYWKTANYAKRESAKWHDSCWPFWGKFFPPAMMWLPCPWKQVCHLWCFHLHRRQWFVSISWRSLGRFRVCMRCQVGVFLLEVLGRMMIMMMMIIVIIIIIILLMSLLLLLVLLAWNGELRCQAWQHYAPFTNKAAMSTADGFSCLKTGELPSGEKHH